MSNILNAVDNSAYLNLASDLRAIAVARGLDAAVSMVDRATMELGKGCFSLAVLGMVKRGKSTFCNALLGTKDDDYAPVGVNPVSNAITEFRNGAPEVRVTFGGGTRSDEVIPKDRIRNFITEQLNPGNRLNVASIVVQDDFPSLPDGVVLVDTPGEGSMNQHHDRLLYEYLPSADAAIFLITAHSPLIESEIAFLKELQAQDVRKVFFAINRADEVDEDELSDAINHNLSVLADNGIPVTQIFPISAKRAFQGNVEGSGMDRLFEAVKGYLDKEKFRVPRSRFMARINALVDSVANGIETEMSARNKTAQDLAVEIEKLKDENITLEEFQRTHLQRVRNAWDSASAIFFSEVKTGLSDLEIRMGNLVRDSRARDVRTLKAEFATAFESTARQKIETAIATFEATVGAAMEDLPITFKGLGMQSGAEGSHSAFSGGTEYTSGRLVLTGVVAALGGAILFSNPVGIALAALGGVAAQFWNTTAKVKDELIKELPATVEKIRQYWMAQQDFFEKRREELINELMEQFRLQKEPTVLALQKALENQGKVDQDYDNQLHELQGMIIAVRNVAVELGKDVVE